jgi:Dolichyl-phosphate-mannose-protein mannosyltransferase
VWDGHYYHFGAQRIAAGLGYSDDVHTAAGTVWHPWCHYPVGYSGFLALVYEIFGARPIVGTVANAVVGAGLAAVVHRLARRALSPGRARAAAILVAISPGLIVYSALLMTEALAAAGILAAVWLLARDLPARPWRGALTAGVVLGLTTLVRPQSVLLAPALALVAWSPSFYRENGANEPGGRLRRAALVAAISTVSALAVVLPWTARNCRVMDGCAFVSTNGGWNLAIGSFPRATGRFETLRGSDFPVRPRTDGCPVATGQVAQDRCWRTEGMRWIASDPGRWLALIPKKLGFTFDHESFPVGYLGEANPGAWPEERRAWWRGFLSTTHRALLAAAALGVVASPSSLRRREGRAGAILQIGALALIGALLLRGFLGEAHSFWPIALLIPALAVARLPGAPRVGGILGYLALVTASVAATHAVFFGEDRYHMVLTPALCILAAAALRRPNLANTATSP